MVGKSTPPRGPASCAPLARARAEAQRRIEPALSIKVLIASFPSPTAAVDREWCCEFTAPRVLTTAPEAERSPRSCSHRTCALGCFDTAVSPTLAARKTSVVASGPSPKNSKKTRRMANSACLRFHRTCREGAAASLIAFPEPYTAEPARIRHLLVEQRSTIPQLHMRT